MSARQQDTFDRNLTSIRDQEKRQLIPVPHDESGCLDMSFDGEEENIPVQSHMHVAYVGRVTKHLPDRNLSQHPVGTTFELWVAYFEKF